MNSIPELERRLTDLVSSASDERARVHFSIDKFRRRAAQTLSEFRDDQRIHGSDENAPFFDLVMFDANPLEAAVFLVPMFLADCLRIFAGTGVPNDVISIGNHLALADVEGMAAELRAKGVSLVLDIPRPLAEHWLASA